MKMQPKPLKEITPADLDEYKVWQYSPSKDGNTWLKPITSRKISKFSNKLVASQVKLANGSKLYALISGVDPETPIFSKHNRQLILYVNNEWFELAKYYASTDVKKICGEDVLSKKLNMEIKDIFPIYFDVKDVTDVNSECLTGFFEVSPAWGLARGEIMEILVNELGEP